jgi:hypothetical protein
MMRMKAGKISRGPAGSDEDIYLAPLVAESSVNKNILRR